ncbi:putative FAD dependent oxidoreductase [Paecilomyces variotii]|uniref:Putative FAD dependent oxidoreductase n=1 Tax=Byssochlamys spectabilis TaxID=264951 RepID=A0A443I5N6_BYSSP|nr:putative FAD dependent oxidoreductase [Paecilomyces variotii]KAJ9194128.1 CAZyme family AA7 [Paecilomyces variotii]KAJ9223217.1 CAZyme family AA7 [Paecilomyces variotii]KAJ9280186.1 CAZyme family AA7 [Paecilomyces variotii]KAJ9342421.1 CAZyme family AA7 [Paecilomyces variotii]KAJ9354484.1 CAZyme family AA7 [Paecilomyces variotii]
MGVPTLFKYMLAASAALYSVTAADFCDTIKAENVEVDGPLSVQYEETLTKYWSAACSALRPSCILAPSSAAEVADIISALHSTDDLFAVKSGGHMPNNGFASIQNGILISMQNLDQVVYDAETETAVVGPGLSWEDAQKGLDGTGRTLVGGRLGGVGVGGYMLGGGLSFLSSQYGWAANNVVNYEVVLANATIVNANKDENQDLFYALKGGGNNFGIVTAYTLQTHPIGQVWGGNYIFPGSKSPEVLEATRTFTEHYPDEKAAVIVTHERALAIDSWIVFLFYDGPTPPQGVFDGLKAVGPEVDTTKTWDTYYDLLKFNDFAILHGQRYLIGTETTPLPNKTVGAEVMQSYHDHFVDVGNGILDVPGLISTMALQPMPRNITSKAKALGGDLIDLPDDQDYIIFELDYSYSLPSSDDKVSAALQDLYSGLHDLVDQHIENSLLPDVYRPLFMNDAYSQQDYWGRIRTKDIALQTRLKYDPDGFFQNRTSGGFRLN